MITTHVELFANVIWELQAELFPRHYDELSLHKAHGIPLSPKFDQVLRTEAEGRTALITMRDRGRIVAYWAEYIDTSMHYSTCLQATMDMFWIDPAYRSGANALKLVRAVEDENRRRGVKLWFAGEKLHKPVGRLFQAIGMTPTEQLWAKWL